MHDIPYVFPNELGPQVVASMTRVCFEAVKSLGNQRSNFKLGIQILACANREALAVAQATGIIYISLKSFNFI